MASWQIPDQLVELIELDIFQQTMFHYQNIHARWCPSSLAKLVYDNNFTRSYGRYIELVNGILNQQTAIERGHPHTWARVNFLCFLLFDRVIRLTDETNRGGHGGGFHGKLVTHD